MNGEERQGIALIMDSCRYTEDPKEYLPVENKILETVIALDLFFLQKAIPVTIYLEEETIKELSGDSLHSFETNYERLSAFRFSSAKRPAALCSGILSSNTLFNKAMVFLIVSRTDPSCFSLMERLQQYNIPLTVIIVNDQPDLAVSQIPSDENSGFVLIRTDADLREVL
jgi:hypothetical protein